MEEQWRHAAWANVARIFEQFYSSMVKVKPDAKVITIGPAQNALTIW
jgi:hypothetical protein